MRGLHQGTKREAVEQAPFHGGSEQAVEVSGGHVGTRLSRGEITRGSPRLSAPASAGVQGVRLSPGRGGRCGSWRVAFPRRLRWPARGSSPPLVRRQGPQLRNEHRLAQPQLKGGADVRHVQELLGHAQLDSTMRYTRVAVSDLAKVIERPHPREKEWIRRGTKA